MKTPISYYGGKQTMLKHILPLIPTHELYTEAFAGGAALLFAKEPVKAEIINDVNMDLTNFYSMMKMFPDDLELEIKKSLHSRDLHVHANHVLKYPVYFTQVQRAWAVWILCKISFASKLNGAFGYDFKGAMSKKLCNAREAFNRELCARLENVTIENRDALKVITTYDSPLAFHFVDPPYVGTHCGHYTGSFVERDLECLLDVLENIKGKFMLTMFPSLLVEGRSEKNGWMIHRVERTISASKTSRRKQEEWMVCNYLIGGKSK